jgi:hypothetical protein
VRPKEHGTVIVGLVVAISMLVSSCRTSSAPPAVDKMMLRVSTQINNQYQVQRPLQRILENIEKDCRNGDVSVACTKLRALSGRITDPWTVSNNWPACYEELFIQYTGGPINLESSKSNTLEETEGPFGSSEYEHPRDR